MSLTGGEGCERVIEAVGMQWPLDLAGELTRDSRSAHHRGLSSGRAAPGEHAALELARPGRHQRARARSACVSRGMRAAVNAVASGLLDPSPLYTHRFPLDRLGSALEATRSRPDGFLKALVVA